jgi:uncharacterized protein DUF1566
MKSLSKLKFGIFVIGALALTSTLTQAQTTANGPYYATPSWDQTLPAATRFIVLSNMNSDAVLDRETGLIWERAPGLQTQTFDLADAFLCNLKNIGGRKGWRVPSVWELLTLVDSTQNPPLPAGNPFNLGSGAPRFWTNTPLSVGFGATTAWVVAFVNDGFSGTSGTTQQLRAWCVRGPGGTAPVNPAMQ